MKSLVVALFLVFLGLSKANVYSSGCQPILDVPLFTVAINLNLVEINLNLGKSGQPDYYETSFSVYISNNCTQTADTTLTFTGTYSESSSTVNAVFASNNASASSSTYGVTSTWSSYTALASSTAGVAFLKAFCNVTVTEGQSFDLGATGCAGMGLMPISQCSTTYSCKYTTSTYLLLGIGVYGVYGSTTPMNAFGYCAAQPSSSVWVVDDTSGSKLNFVSSGSTVLVSLTAILLGLILALF